MPACGKLPENGPGEKDIGTDPAAFGKGDTTDMYRNTPLNGFDK